ncbi:hypothetical protein SAMN05216404_108141 [Nitrosospira multiformis]|uniref:Lipoprotein n=1 Tax=Nitrosospira multiformis TaxID=1231 RepID=A0A1H8KGS0_9PROT|nr:hypothetical protein [Nitrosospira multiformis]SEN92092.1 hypothetical protein SAMN05216404_108141 [Nitrosospira multiformis]
MKLLLSSILMVLIAGSLLSCEKDSSTKQEHQTRNNPEPWEESWGEYQSKTTAPYARHAPPTFMGYTCTIDCSGHEAGYEWAEENDIHDPDDCGGNSDSFIEGCIAYAEERQAQASDTEELDYDY